MGRHKRIQGALRKALKAAGGRKALAKALGIREQSINNWRRVPRGRILDVERISGVSRVELAPDLYVPKRQPRYLRIKTIMNSNRGA